jgi:hypothetical protein
MKELILYYKQYIKPICYVGQDFATVLPRPTFRQVFMVDQRSPRVRVRFPSGNTASTVVVANLLKLRRNQSLFV